jgi:hypothetical protein
LNMDTSSGITFKNVFNYSSAEPVWIVLKLQIHIK